MSTVVDLTEETENPGFFWEGACKLTYNRFSGDRLSFDELLGDLRDIKLALVSAYCVDEDWVFGKMRTVPKVIAVTHWDRSSETQGSHEHPYWSNVTVVHPPFPKFPSYGVMHSKLMLLFTAERLRIVISTGNLVEYDYSEVQNAVFVQDLKKKNREEGVASCQFKAELERLLRRFGTSVKPFDFNDYDWSKVTAQLVASEPGSHFGRFRTGLIQLKEASLDLAQKHLNNDASLSFEYQCSSLGAFTEPWLQDVVDAITAGSSRETKDLKVVFPTSALVKRSPLGPGAFGTIFCKAKDWASPKQPRGAFHECEALGRMAARPLHTKLFVVLSNGQPLYYYLGSANFTPSAWGRFVKDDQQLMVSNFELGVLLDAAKHPVPWPYHRPLKRYTAEDVPWTQS